ncbi:MAG: hypothetical protein ACLGHY_02650, partial [Gammaproteobacteria bacterium]
RVPLGGRVLEVRSDGTLATLAGTGHFGKVVDGAPATSAGRHQGSEYQPRGTGRPATMPPG